MSDNQDALLALADRIQEADNNLIAINPAASDEMRRLVAENEALKAKVVRERNSLEAARDELVKALTEVLEFQSAKEGPSIYDWGRWRKVRDRAALVNAQGESEHE